MVSRGEARRIRALHRRRGREREGRFLAEGVRVVEELLDAGIVLHGAVVSSSLEDTERGRRLRARLDEQVAVEETGDGELAELADTASPQGVLVVAGTPRAGLGAVEVGPGGVVLVLDGVQDPGNLGTLARSAAAFGCRGVVVLPGTVDPWNPKAVRASAGSLFRLPVVAAELAELRGWLDGAGLVLAGADAAGSPVGPAPELAERAGREGGAGVALVLGNEGAGLSPEVAAACDLALAVPMRGGTESLNVAVAGSILLYELTRERG